MLKLSNFSSIFIANWKLNGNYAFIKEYYQNLSTNSNNCIVICAPNIYLHRLQSNKKNLFFGAQDVSLYNEGAYTGEVSADMLNENKTNFCIVGHSERRQLFNETNNNIKLKAINLIDKNIIPVICVGETLKEKESKITKSVLLKQLEETIPDIANIENTLVAYEPIWAIGTGKTCEANEANRICGLIRKWIGFEDVIIQYGGSVKSNNIDEIMSMSDIDGVLVGGASLDPTNFARIANYETK